MREYDQIAEWYTSTRSPMIGLPEVAAFAEALPVGAKVLDLGCGDGVPISRFLVEEGFEVVGLDSSAEMVRRFRANLPGVRVHLGRAQDARVPLGSLDAVVAWGVVFHLADADQAAVLARASEWLRPGGTLLFTSGDTAGARDGTMDGVAFRYVSLDSEGYGRILERAGMHLVRDYVGSGGNHTYVAKKTAGPATAS